MKLTFHQKGNEYCALLSDEAATLTFAQKIALAFNDVIQHGLLDHGMIVYLRGNLGAGKSFLSRGVVQYFLPKQKVKSPTYTLVETYSCDVSGHAIDIHHFDLYRLCDPEELEFLGIRDLLTQNSLSLVEWPSKGEGVLPSADIEIQLQTADTAREVTICFNTNQGQQLVEKLIK